MWYNSLTTPEKVFFYIAVIGTVLLVVQIILMLVSFGGDADVDGDFGGDGDFDTPDGGLGVSLFTLKGLTAFFAIGGWVGLLILQINSKNIALAIIVSLVSGLFSMVLVALALRGIAKLQCNGNLDKEKLIGKEATVYVSIAPSRTGQGKNSPHRAGRVHGTRRRHRRRRTHSRGRKSRHFRNRLRLHGRQKTCRKAGFCGGKL